MKSGEQLGRPDTETWRQQQLDSCVHAELQSESERRVRKSASRRKYYSHVSKRSRTAELKVSCLQLQVLRNENVSFSTCG